jgi:predicted O-linked N-acetylglucosamine transferase (SPINDLY family)
MRPAQLPRGATARALFDDGTRAQAAGKMGEAADRYRAAIALDAKLFEAHVNLGNALLDLHEPEKALASFDRSLELRPDYLALHFNRARALEALSRYEAAIECYEKVKRANAASPDPEATSSAWQGPGPGYIDRRIGNARICQGDALAAAASFRKALTLEPENAEIASVLLMSLLYSDPGNGPEVWNEHRRLAGRHAWKPAKTEHTNSPQPDRRLKIGYVSGDFRNHSVAYFIEPILANHDRASIEVFCYFTSTRSDQVTRRLRNLADNWRDCSPWSDEEFAGRIQADGVDILVDLAGHSEYNRTQAFARKPAPIQISWIGYPLGTGLSEIDYRLSDSRASPGLLAQGACASKDGEPLYLLPEVFSCYRPPSHAPAPKRSNPEASDEIVLGSFNNLAKVSGQIVRIWAALLRTNANFSLLLKDNAFRDEAARLRILAQFHDNGVPAERLQLRTRTRSDRDHLESYGDIDIALDTFPYGGVTTTCEALWMGVPVVSLAGNHFASRMGATLLNAVGHPEWVASDEQGYAQAILALAKNAAHRANLRASLRDEMRGSVLLDETHVTKDLEAAYRDMWRNWCARKVATEDFEQP